MNHMDRSSPSIIARQRNSETSFLPILIFFLLFFFPQDPIPDQAMVIFFRLE